MEPNRSKQCGTNFHNDFKDMSFSPTAVLERFGTINVNDFNARYLNTYLLLTLIRNHKSTAAVFHNQLVAD